MTTIDKSQIQAAYLGDTRLYKILDGTSNPIFQDVKIQIISQDTTVHPPEFAKTASFYLQGGGGGGKGGFAFSEARPRVGQGGQAGGYREILGQPIEDFWRTEGLQVKVGQGGQGATPSGVQNNPNGKTGGWTGVKLKKNESFYAAGGGQGGRSDYVENDYFPGRIEELKNLVAGGSLTNRHITVPRTFNPTHNIYPAIGGKLVYNEQNRGLFRFTTGAESSIVGGINGIAGGGGSGGSRGGYGKTVTTGGKGGDGWVIVVWIP